MTDFATSIDSNIDINSCHSRLLEVIVDYAIDQTTNKAADWLTHNVQTGQ